MHNRRMLILLGAVMHFTATAALATNMDSTILVIRGLPPAPLASYRAADLTKDFPSQTMTTQTPWSNGLVRTYRGYALTDILSKSGLMNAKNIIGEAPNDFAARIDIGEIKKYSPIIASEILCDAKDAMSGKCTEGNYRPLESDDYGPFFIVWPFDKLPKVYEPNDHSRWIWFVSELRPTND